MKDEKPDDPGCRPIPWAVFSLCLVALLSISLIARLYRLDERLLHHDESMVASFSWQLFDGRGYQYNPLLHGPFLFYLNTIIFFLFGVSDYTTRLGQALFGTGLVGFVYAFRKQIGEEGVLAAAALLGLGPTFLYFTRFAKPDPVLIFFFVLFIFFCLRYCDRGSNSDLYGAAASLSLVFCSKENAYLYLGVFVSFLLVLLIYGTPEPEGAESTVRARGRAVLDHIKKKRWPFAIGFLIFWALYILLYSSFFTHPGGVLDGLYRQSLKFWFGQHVQPGGWEATFSFYLPLLVIYEAPVLIFLAYGLYRHLARDAVSRAVFLGASGLTCLLGLYWDQDFPKGLLPVVHIDKISYFLIALYALGIGLWATIRYLREGEVFRAFIVHWAALSFAGYSSIWVKAPWFFVHILLPHIFLAAIFFGDFWRSGFRVRRRALTTAFVALLAALMIHNTVLLNYYYASDPRERMVTAQTSPEVSRILKLINDVSFRLGTGYDTPMAVKEAAAWPMGWYLRNYKNWYHPGDLTVADKGKAIIIGDWNERESLRSLLGQDYVEMTFPCRGWCIADAKDMTFHKLWRYFMYREAFNSVVYSYLVVYVRRDLSSGYTL